MFNRVFSRALILHSKTRIKVGNILFALVGRNLRTSSALRNAIILGSFAKLFLICCKDNANRMQNIKLA